MEHCRSPDGVTSVSVRLYHTTQCCRVFTLALARLSCLSSCKLLKYTFFERIRYCCTWSHFVVCYTVTKTGGSEA